MANDWQCGGPRDPFGGGGPLDPQSRNDRLALPMGDLTTTRLLPPVSGWCNFVSSDSSGRFPDELQKLRKRSQAREIGHCTRSYVARFQPIALPVAGAAARDPAKDTADAVACAIVPLLLLAGHPVDL